MLSLVADGALAVIALTGTRRLRGVIINEHWLSTEETRAHVDWLGKRFHLIHHDQLVRRLVEPAARPFCLLTFDDGKRSNATETAPELIRLGVPAVFYLTTGFVGGRRAMWFDRLHNLVRILGRAPTGLAPHIVKQLPHRILEERLDRACAAHGIELDLDDDRIAPMSWNDARALARHGFTVGAHGMRHTVLPHEREADALAEIAGSMACVSREVGVPCRTFAFPNGDYTALLARHAQACGAETVMTTEPTWVGSHPQPWRLPRVQLFPGSTRARVELKLLAAATGRLLVNPDGSGRLYTGIAGANWPDRA
jgi:peptidoglycan/xylan/chitin deacetylase (PgdA/CDA1 family)